MRRNLTAALIGIFAGTIAFSAFFTGTLMWLYGEFMGTQRDASRRRHPSNGLRLITSSEFGAAYD